MSDSHDHSHGETPSYDDINTPVIVLVGAIAAVVTLLTVFLVQGMCYHWQNQFLNQRSVKQDKMPAYQEIQKQKQRLTGTEEGLTSIEQAQQIVIAKFKK